VTCIRTEQVFKFPLGRSGQNLFSFFGCLRKPHRNKSCFIPLGRSATLRKEQTLGCLGTKCQENGWTRTDEATKELKELRNN
jgi:hypothetical protein